MFTFHVTGIDGNRQKWSFEGRTSDSGIGGFVAMTDVVMEKVFLALTEGRALYGKPGVACSGPYQIRTLRIEEIL
jgi:hypothetical protein